MSISESDARWLAEQKALRYKTDLLGKELKFKALLEHEARMRDIYRDFIKGHRKELENKKQELSAEISDIDIELDMMLKK